MIEKFMNKYILVLVIILSFVSCNKAVNDYNSEFVGYWKSDVSVDVITGFENQSHFIIGENHNECGISCVPNCFECDCLNFAEGRAQVNVNRTKIRIGQSRNTVTLSIDDEPYINSDSVWVCKLNNVIYYKQ